MAWGVLPGCECLLGEDVVSPHDAEQYAKGRGDNECAYARALQPLAQLVAGQMRADRRWSAFDDWFDALGCPCCFESRSPDASKQHAGGAEHERETVG